MAHSISSLETVSVVVPGEALEAYEAAVRSACRSTAMFLDDETGLWTVEGVREVGAGVELAGAIAIAELLTGVRAVLARRPVAADGWIARTATAFPEQLIGRRFAVRGTHLTGPRVAGRITLVLDASVAFGSGEHGSTRGCLRALDLAARRRPRRILDMGTGSGILAMGAARLTGRRVLATDIDPLSVRTARRNAVRNGLRGRIRFALADGWRSPLLRKHAPFDLVLANILARPLTLMAKELAAHTARGGRVVLAGLLARQARWVLSAHRRHGLSLAAALREGPWMTLLLRRR